MRMNIGLRALVSVFFILAIADVPIFCPDERPEPSTLALASGSGVGSPLQITVAPGSEAAPAQACSCPCHHQFRAEQGTPISSLSLAVTAIDFCSSPALPAPPRSLDRPPQNRA